MLKKIITLSIVTAVVLIGVENLIAQEQTDTPRQQPRRRQGQEGLPGQRGRAQQFSGQQEKDSESQAKRTEAMRKRAEAAGKKAEAMQQKRQKETAQKGAPQGRMGRSQQSRPGRNQPMQRMTGRRNQRLKGRGISDGTDVIKVKVYARGVKEACAHGMRVFQVEAWVEGGKVSRVEA